MSGWVKIERDDRQNFPFADERYSHYEAWLDLISHANWEDRIWQSKEGPVEVKRGSFIASQESLAERWGWSKWAVKRYLNSLSKAQLIRYSTATRPQLGRTHIEILNYDKYQGVNEHEQRTPATKPQLTRNGSAPKPLATKELIIRNKKEEEEYNKPPNPLTGDPVSSDELPIDIFPETKTVSSKPKAEPERELDPDLQAWVDYRKIINKPLKNISIEAIEREYIGRPDELRAAVRNSIRKGYDGLVDPPVNRFTPGSGGIRAASMHQNQRKSQNLVNQERTMQELKELLEECGHDVGTNGFPIS